MKRTLLLTVVLCVTSAFSLSGCGPKQPSVGFETFAQWSTTINHPDHPGKEGGPGISEAQISAGMWNGNSVLVVWVPMGSCKRFMAGTPDPANPDLRYRWDFSNGLRGECETKDGKTGTMRLGGTNYSLADGAFFLVSVQGEKLGVKQLKRDVTTLKHGEAAFKELAKSDAEIRSFFLEPEQPK
jgi:hypothetical protein